MSRIRFTAAIKLGLTRIGPAKLLPTALAAALVVSASLASAQDSSYYQNAPSDQGASYDQNASDQNVSNDPSSRVARLAYLSGDVELAPAGESTWGTADVNRPLTTGDRLLTGSDGRAALELGDAALRINDNSAFNFLQLDDTSTQVELSQGTLNMRVRQLGNGQNYEVDTPTVAFVASQPGRYRVDVAPDGNGAMLTVFEGAGVVYGENGVSRDVAAGQSYRFNDTALTNVAVQGLPAPDDFDRFSEARDNRYTNSVSRRYVSPEVVGYDDLDQYGDWQSTPDNGEVWYPNQVAAGWTPYRDGHWAWIDPWGWTWVDDEPWGYAPFHYGRWAYVRDRWGWVPGQIDERPVYAPALVAFVGGSGFGLSISLGGGGYGGGYDNQPVGWFPLGPRDVYVPPYRASRGYFNSVNVTNIRNVYVNKTVINNYYGNYAAGRPFAGTRDYAFRNNPRAFTAVPRNVFANARPVKAAVVRIDPAKLAKATIAPIPHVVPTRASLGIRTPQHRITAPVEKSFQRTVVARHAPPPPSVPFAAREKLLAKQGGAPLPVAQLHQMRQQRAKTQPESQRVRVVSATPKPGAPNQPANPRAGNGRPPMTAPGQPAKPVVQAPRPGQPNPPHSANAIHPIQVPVNPAKPDNAAREAPMRPGELRSARFAHPQRGASSNPAAAAGNPAQQKRATQVQAKAAQEQQHAAQTQQNAEAAHAQQAQQRAAAAGQEAQTRDAQKQQAQDRQQAAQARAQQEHQRAQQAQQQATQQRDAQDRAAKQQQARAAQAKAQQDQQRAADAQRASQAREAQQREAQARQRQEQAQAQQSQQRAQQAQQRADQARAQQQEAQQRQAQAQQAQQQRAQQARQQQQPHAAAPQRTPQENKKRKDAQDQQNGGG